MDDGESTVPGPFSFEARSEILSRLTKIQENIGLSLISDDEIHKIKEIWSDDVLARANRHLKKYEIYKARTK